MSERYTPCPVCKGEVSHHAACSVPVLGPPADDLRAALDADDEQGRPA